MSVGSILSSINPINLVSGLIEHADKSNYGTKLFEGGKDILEGIFELDPGKVMDGLGDITKSTLDQVATTEFLGLLGYTALGCMTGGVGVFVLGAAADGIAGWFEGDDRKAPAQPDPNARGAQQVDPRAQGDLGELRAGRNGTGNGCAPAPACGHGAGGTGGASQTELHVENEVVMDSNGNLIVNQSVSYDAGAYATGGAHGSAPAQGAQSCREESVEVDLAEAIEWAKRRGYFTEEELRHAAALKAPNGKPLFPNFPNPRMNEELATLLEKKLKSDPEILASFESTYGKVDFTKEAKDNGFVYVNRQVPTQTAPPPTFRDPPVSGPPKSDPTYSLPSTGGGEVGGTKKLEVNQKVTISSYEIPKRDPNRFEGLSPEQIVRMLMMELLQDADGAMVSTARNLKDAQERELKVKQAKADGEEVSSADEVEARQNVTQLESELQDIIAKRKQTYDLLSHFASNQNEMAKTAIGNIGRI